MAKGFKERIPVMICTRTKKDSFAWIAPLSCLNKSGANAAPKEANYAPLFYRKQDTIL